MGHICSEIEYVGKDGGVHSDLCIEFQGDSLPNNIDWRKMLHSALDEWLDKSRGTGLFYVGMLPENESH